MDPMVAQAKDRVSGHHSTTASPAGSAPGSPAQAATSPAQAGAAGEKAPEGNPVRLHVSYKLYTAAYDVSHGAQNE